MSSKTDVCVDDFITINFANQMGTTIEIDGPSGEGNPQNIFRASGAIPALFNNGDGTAELLVTFAEPKDVISVSFETMFASFVTVDFRGEEDNLLDIDDTVS